MMLALYFLLFSIGLVFIIKGSDWFVDATIWIARISRIPEFIIGATLVSLCTTLPELLVSTGAALNQDTSMAFGNVVGSVACNTGLILGIIVTISTPTLFHKTALTIKSVFISLALALYYIIALIFGQLNYFTGLIFLSFSVLYVVYNYIEAKKHRKTLKLTKQPVYSRKTIAKNISLFVAGLLFTIAGAYIMIIYGQKIAVELKVPSLIIGVTMTAFGTSLPELVTAITALRKKAVSLSIGNIFGANILNLTLVLGTTSIIRPVICEGDIISFHLPAILLITLIAAAGTIFSKKKYPRFLGILLLFSYLIYIILTALSL